MHFYDLEVNSFGVSPGDRDKPGGAGERQLMVCPLFLLSLYLPHFQWEKYCFVSIIG